jgi:hypothetical protein
MSAGTFVRGNDGCVWKTGGWNYNRTQTAIIWNQDRQLGGANMLLKFCDNMHTMAEMILR